MFLSEIRCQKSETSIFYCVQHLPHRGWPGLVLDLIGDLTPVDHVVIVQEEYYKHLRVVSHFPLGPAAPGLRESRLPDGTEDV